MVSDPFCLHRIEGPIEEIFGSDDGFALFLKEMGFNPHYWRDRKTTVSTRIMQQNFKVRFTFTQAEMNDQMVSTVCKKSTTKRTSLPREINYTPG